MTRTTMASRSAPCRHQPQHQLHHLHLQHHRRHHLHHHQVEHCFRATQTVHACIMQTVDRCANTARSAIERTLSTSRDGITHPITTQQRYYYCVELHAYCVELHAYCVELRAFFYALTHVRAGVARFCSFF